MLIVYPHRRYGYYPRPAWQPAQSEKVFAVKAIATCSAYPHIVRGFFATSIWPTSPGTPDTALRTSPFCVMGTSPLQLRLRPRLPPTAHTAGRGAEKECSLQIRGTRIPYREVSLAHDKTLSISSSTNTFVLLSRLRLPAAAESSVHRARHGLDSGAGPAAAAESPVRRARPGSESSRASPSAAPAPRLRPGR